MTCRRRLCGPPDTAPTAALAPPDALARAFASSHQTDAETISARAALADGLRTVYAAGGAAISAIGGLTAAGQGLVAVACGAGVRYDGTNAGFFGHERAGETAWAEA